MEIYSMCAISNKRVRPVMPQANHALGSGRKHARYRTEFAMQISSQDEV